ncbi:unnamed protein product [Miscanthus lutarioriparius]|uniref:Biogenesis of lysosome-related organelles complex 1 subunit 1 n=1 Tax=Miscanthus lutarioriparius TaxID=422564 RepID=A0A811RG26_9POAL|nr:unnamed protein product [Miscanthus lutarioriparius]
MDGAKPTAAAGGKQELEDALLQIMQQHHHQSFHQRQQTERAKKDALRSAARVADLLVDTVDDGEVQELFVNEKRVELEARALLGTIARYRKQSDQWLAATNEINSVLKAEQLELSTLMVVEINNVKQQEHKRYKYRLGTVFPYLSTGSSKGADVAHLHHHCTEIGEEFGHV